MARPRRTDTERKRGRMRAAALMNSLARQIGAQNPNQFALQFDALSGMNTQSSGKWRSSFNGEKALSTQQLQLLSRIDPEVFKRHEMGPANLWQAMWAPLQGLRSIVSTELALWPTLEVLVAEFEGDLLLAEAYHEPLTIAHLAKAVALHRLVHELNARIIPVGIDGEGTYRAIRRCLDDTSVSAALASLGIFDDVDAELSDWLAGHEELASTPAAARWNALASRLDWIA